MSSTVTGRPLVYVAARFQDRVRALQAAIEMERHGVRISSTWLYKNVPEAIWAADKRKFALYDLQDLDVSDALVLFNPADSRGRGSGGCKVEQGYALARGKQVIILGEGECVFDYLGSVMWASTPEEAAIMAKSDYQFRKAA